MITTIGARLPDGPHVTQADAEASLARSVGDEAHLSEMPELWDYPAVTAA